MSLDRKLTPTNRLLTKTTLNRKGTGINLVNTLRQLSGHVKQLRSEKFATNVTRLVSLMQQANNNPIGTKSTLSNLYLAPPAGSGVGTNVSEEEVETLFLNSDFREGFTNAIRSLTESNELASPNIGASSGNINTEDMGRITLDQFMAILRYLHSSQHISSISANNNQADAAAGSGSSGGPPSIATPASSNNNSSSSIGLGPLIISKFVDRDNDGYISADDIFAAQALIMQRSEIFLKV
jgi:hypothetical protein